MLTAGALGVALAGLGGPVMAQDAHLADACPSGLLALTFDDGPDVHTGAVLDTLADHDVGATFFVEGHKVVDDPQLVQRAAEEGHEVANHTYDHVRLTEVSDEEVARQVRLTAEVIADAGVDPLPLLRPPFGATDARVASIVEAEGHVEKLWDVDPRDWEQPSDQISSYVLDHLAPGAVILLHDGSTNTPETIDALPAIIDGARDAGYCFGVLDGAGDIVPPDVDDGDDPAPQPREWVGADLTGDRGAEAAGFSPEDGSWVVGETDGASFAFDTRTTFTTSRGWQTHTTADLTGDGAESLLSFHDNGSWWITSDDGDGALTFTRGTDFSTGAGWQTHVVADLTGDGAESLLSFHDNGSWWITDDDGDGALTFTRGTDFTTASGWQTHVVGDVSGDGTDGVVSFHDNGSWWHTRVGEDGDLVWSRFTEYTTTSGWIDHLAVDLSGDGVDELASVHDNGSWWVTGADGTTSGWGSG
jgi:peptidoglycan/xylan/chitin deacetylase (PgdA/CDA1 family)